MQRRDVAIRKYWECWIILVCYHHLTKYLIPFYRFPVVISRRSFKLERTFRPSIIRAFDLITMQRLQRPSAIIRGTFLHDLISTRCSAEALSDSAAVSQDKR